ncbi:MAG: IMP cyclohydrolase [Eubacteriales bacterium]
MNVYESHPIAHWIQGNPYVGRGIVIGKTADGTKAAVAYFIMGRSANSRNRVFVREGSTLLTKPFDLTKVEDPSLIIYAALRQTGHHLIVTNGDQTDTIDDGLCAGKTFAQALQGRTFEPDPPHYTPRISGLLTFAEGDFSYRMSILKSGDAAGTVCHRHMFAYEALAGLGHFIHTYEGDGHPLPTFRGEPRRVLIPDSIDELTASLWENLHPDNRISLYVRYICLRNGSTEERLLNRHGHPPKEA